MIDKYEYSEDFQVKILSCIARNKSFMENHRTVLSSNYFEYGYLVSLSKIIFDHFDKYKVIPDKESLLIDLDKVNVEFKLPNVMYEKLRSTILNVYTLVIPDIKFISDEVSNFGTKQAYKSYLIEAITLMKTNKILDVKGIFKKALDVGRSRNSTISFMDIANDLPNHVPYFNGNNNYKVVPTLFPSLDKAMIFKGLRSGELLEIVGHPGFGKSTLATNFALNAALAGFEVYILSTELTESAYIMKIASRLSQMPIIKIIDEYDRYLERINKFFAERDLKLHIQSFPMYKCTTDDIRAYMSAQISIHGANPGLLVLDSGDHIIANHRNLEKSRFDYGIIYGDLINMGREYEFPIITTTQGNRATMGRGVFGIEGDSESFHKPAMCDVVLTLSRTPEQIQDGSASIFVAKLREGIDKFTIPVEFDLSRSFIREMVS